MIERETAQSLAVERVNCQDDLANTADVRFLIGREEIRKARELSGQVEPDQYKRLLLDHFLRTNGSFVVGAREAKHCGSVDCLYETFYGKDSLSSLLSYLFWLKTGYVLAVVNQLPHWANPPVSGPYKFSPLEISALTKIALSTDEITHLRSLDALYRLPEGWGPGGNACGIAYSSGEIIFADACLTDQSLSTNFLHEIGHHADYSVGTNYQPYGISSTDRWMDLSGWHIMETKDPTTGLVVRRQWAASPEANFWRSYSASSPYEDWADHYSLYRNHPVEMRKISPPKYEFILENGFRKYEFLDQAEMVNQSNIALNASQEAFLNDLPKCVPNENVTDDVVKKCFETTVQTWTEKAKDWMLHSSVRSCRVVRKNPSSVTDYIGKSLQPLIGDFVKDLSYFIEATKVAMAYTEVLNRIDLSTPYVACFAERDLDTCFTAKLDAIATTKISSDWKKYAERVAEVKASYIKNISMDKIAAQTQMRYKRMFSEATKVLGQLAVTGWTICSSVAPSISSEYRSQSAVQMQDYLNPAIQFSTLPTPPVCSSLKTHELKSYLRERRLINLLLLLSFFVNAFGLILRLS